jgi:hypothetical protein
MAYYRGDYYMGGYRGDYYRGRAAGDPFWGALWTGIKTVGGALLGTLKTGAAAQQQQAQISGGLSGVQGAASPMYAQGGLLGTMQPIPGIRSAQAENQAIGQAARGQRSMLRAQTMQQLPDGSFGVRRRRMNPANPKALRRSIRRVVGFGKLAMRSRRAVGKAATALQCHRSSSRRSFPARKR